MAWRRRRKLRHWSICSSSATASCGAATSGSLRCRLHGWRERPPDPPQRVVDRLPLSLLLGELRAALRGDPVVLAPAAALRDLPARLDVAEALESMQDGVEHPVRPLHASAGDLADALEDRVAVAVRLGEDRENDRGRGRGDQILVDLHVTASVPRTYMAPLYIAELCMSERRAQVRPFPFAVGRNSRSSWVITNVRLMAPLAPAMRSEPPCVRSRLSATTNVCRAEES